MTLNWREAIITTSLGALMSSDIQTQYSVENQSSKTRVPTLPDAEPDVAYLTDVRCRSYPLRAPFRPTEAVYGCCRQI